MNTVGRIYNYIYNNWIVAYPFLTEIGGTGVVFPLASECILTITHR